ncbi:MAG: contractile injection system protein, VgrG/Pvc8 family, partial [Pirellula sp.]|nr:contractile injection system protein, VgrG/Pvc8 family [Pirellula sp.]
MSKRLLELEPTGLFGDEAILTTLDGHEEISKPFDFLLTIASTKTTLKPEDVIGKQLAVRINRDEKDPRYIHGYVSSFWAGNSVAHATGGTKFRMYRVRIVPWVWFMSQASRCFVYLPEKQEKTIQDVLDKVIERVTSYGHVVPTIEPGNAKILTTRMVEHCVQYRETDLNFMSRTLERYGVRYYYKYTNSSHTVILSDQINYPNLPEPE